MAVPAGARSRYIEGGASSLSAPAEVRAPGPFSQAPPKMKLIAGFASALAVFHAALAVPPRPSSRQLFERRILPLLKTSRPSSCAECHLGGVDLSNYIAPTEAQTFLSLRDQGLVDVKTPKASRILRLIRMSSPRSSLVARKVREVEYAAFRDWIRACAQNPALAAAPALPTSRRRRPAAADTVIRHGRLDQLRARFEATVWAQQQRCAGCHAPGSEMNAKAIAENGVRVNWVVPNDPEATLARIFERKLLSTGSPAKSLLLLKPTLAVPHGGGQKMVLGDAGYKLFRRFAEDYAAIVNGRYRTAAQLPAAPKERYVSTEYWLKIEETPPVWADRLLGVDLYAYDERARRWSSRRVATSDRPVFGKGRLWQHNLDLVIAAGARPVDLSRGRYLARIYVDRKGDLANDWTRELRRPENLAAELELSPGWQPGYGSMKVTRPTRRP
jgi:hypothetical protein